VNPFVLLPGLLPPAPLAVLEVGAKQREVDPDARGLGEPLVLEVALPGDLGLAVVVNQDEAGLLQQLEQALQGLNGAVAVQDAMDAVPAISSGEVGVG
jgi:hypothetical protein